MKLIQKPFRWGRFEKLPAICFLLMKMKTANPILKTVSLTQWTGRGSLRKISKEKGAIAKPKTAFRWECGEQEARGRWRLTQDAKDRVDEAGGRRTGSAKENNESTEEESRRKMLKRKIKRQQGRVMSALEAINGAWRKTRKGCWKNHWQACIFRQLFTLMWLEGDGDDTTECRIMQPYMKASISQDKQK